MISEPGEADVLELQEVDDPIIKDDEVLIKVVATALNQADTVQRKGSYPPPKGASPYLGLECSGIIEAVGVNVSCWNIGDQVIHGLSWKFISTSSYFTLLHFFWIFSCSYLLLYHYRRVKVFMGFV